MRIISGQYRGKKLFSPTRDDVRPTTDRARESLFNILNNLLKNEWENYQILEVFAGTGAFSLEAVSRGAKQACLVDLTLSDIKKNLELFPKERDKFKLMKTSAINLPQAIQKFNLYFSDAPYQKELSEKALISAFEQGWLSSDVLCVIELEKNEEFALPQQFELIDTRLYGLAKFLFLRLIKISQ